MGSAKDNAATSIGTVFDTVFQLIDEWRAAVEDLVAVSGGAVSAASIDDLTETLVVPRLSGEGALIIGAGFVAAPGFLVDAHWHLAWWLGQKNTFGMGPTEPTLRRLRAEEDPTSDRFRDYTALEWWRVPNTTLSRHITGPYVDYLCTDEYTLTLTVPVLVNGSMIGVVGADLYVRDVERTLLPAIRAIGAPATLVNASRRIVVSTDPHRPTGTILRDPTARVELACADTSLILIVD